MKNSIEIVINQFKNLNSFIEFMSCVSICCILILTKKWHGSFTLDTMTGVQKFHTSPTPRIGGVPLMLGLVVAITQNGGEIRKTLISMLSAGAFAFIAGTIEDLTKNVGVKYRLLATMMSGFVAWHITGYSISDVGVWGLNSMLEWLPFSVFFTMIAVGGVANAVNIIDGFNGLASGFLFVAYIAMGLIAANVGDVDVMVVCVTFAVITFGFFVFNFPFGKMFLGDGGAYLMGFLLAWVAVILPLRNPEVSSWATLMVCSYPVLEVFFSVCRKCRREGHHPGQPDKVHLHMLIHKRVAKKIFRNASPVIKNSLTSVLIWPYAFLSSLIGFLFYNEATTLVAFYFLMVFFYHLVYLRLTRFRWVIR
jgi:UDP-N-acetylmuramyl pentapeptide phosphotransferase/UDP-N-acetylglucosamine-1-phosphate transferase